MNTIILRQSNEIVGTPIYNTHLPTAQREAQTNGVAATMPMLLAARAQQSLSNDIWQNWFTASTEEDSGATIAGKSMVVVAHGTPILRPDRIESAYREGLYVGGARLTKEELNSVAKNAIHIDDFFGMTQEEISELGVQYSVVLPFKRARQTVSGYQSIDGLYENPLFIARAGGTTTAHQFLDKLRTEKISNYGQWHIFNDVDERQAQGRLLFLYSHINGLSGNDSLINDGRFVRV